MTRRSNVLVLMSDEHNPKYLGVAGHPYIETPNLDALARARHALHVRVHHLPDLRAGARGVRHRPLRARDRLLGQRRCLRRRDAELAPRAARGGASRGVDRQAALPRPSRRRPRLHRGDRADARDRRHRRREGPRAREHPRAQGRRQDGQATPAPASRRTPSTTARSRRARRSGCTRRRRATTARPWVLFVSFVAPHFPLTAPPEWYYRYARMRLPLPKQYAKHERPHHVFTDDYARVRRLRHALPATRPTCIARSPATRGWCRRWTRTWARCWRARRTPASASRRACSTRAITATTSARAACGASRRSTRSPPGCR